MRPLPSRNTLGADSTYFTDTGGYAWEVRPDASLVTVASPSGTATVYTPSTPGYAAVLAQVQRGTVGTRAAVIQAARTRGGMEVGTRGSAPVTAATPTSASPAPPAPAAATPVNAAPPYEGREGAPTIPGWVLPAAAAGAIGLVLVMLPGGGSRNTSNRCNACGAILEIGVDGLVPAHSSTCGGRTQCAGVGFLPMYDEHGDAREPESRMRHLQDERREAGKGMEARRLAALEAMKSRSI